MLSVKASGFPPVHRTERGRRGEFACTCVCVYTVGSDCCALGIWQAEWNRLDPSRHAHAGGSGRCVCVCVLNSETLHAWSNILDFLLFFYIFFWARMCLCGILGQVLSRDWKFSQGALRVFWSTVKTEWADVIRWSWSSGCGGSL